MSEQEQMNRQEEPQEEAKAKHGGEKTYFSWRVYEDAQGKVRSEFYADPDWRDEDEDDEAHGWHRGPWMRWGCGPGFGTGFGPGFHMKFRSDPEWAERFGRRMEHMGRRMERAGQRMGRRMERMGEKFQARWEQKWAHDLRHLGKDGMREVLDSFEDLYDEFFGDEDSGEKPKGAASEL